MTFFGRSKKRKASTLAVQPPPLKVQFAPLPQPLPPSQTVVYNALRPPQSAQALLRPLWPARRPAQPVWNNGPYQQPQRYPASQPYLPIRPQATGSHNISPPPQFAKPSHPAKASKASSSLHLPHYVTAPVQTINDGLGEWQHKTTEYLNCGAALCDRVAEKLNEVLTSIDGEVFSGKEEDLVIQWQPPPLMIQPRPQQMQIQHAGHASRGNLAMLAPKFKRKEEVFGQGVSHAQAAANQVANNSNIFAKVDFYHNSCLHPNLQPFKLYLPTWQLVCLAAKLSLQVYASPKGPERETHVDADWRLGTKAMVIKSAPLDDMNIVFFAIRGSQTFMDWAVNLNSAPASPKDFLDDEGNFCHSGFLQVAKKMIKPVAARLRSLLEENPRRSGCSLVITGHSAGGAVASLLYAHMMATEAKSELNCLTDCFKRIHCISFGAPPVSLLPLLPPTTHRHRKSVFLSFVNEGDPVARADKPYIRSLLDLYASPIPSPSTSNYSNALALQNSNTSPLAYTPETGGGKHGKQKKHRKPSKPNSPPVQQRPRTPPVPTKPHWKVPPSTLSNAGRLVLLRAAQTPDGREGVQALVTNDEELRGVIFGNPVMHMMKVYSRRVEVLATNAMLPKGF